MDRVEYINQRKGRYMAQVLEDFEEKIEAKAREGGVPDRDIDDFKGLVRARLTALAADAVNVIQLGDDAINGLALELRDRLTPTG